MKKYSSALMASAIILAGASSEAKSFNFQICEPITRAELIDLFNSESGKISSDDSSLGLDGSVWEPIVESTGDQQPVRCDLDHGIDLFGHNIARTISFQTKNDQIVNAITGAISGEETVLLAKTERLDHHDNSVFEDNSKIVQVGNSSELQFKTWYIWGQGNPETFGCRFLEEQRDRMLCRIVGAGNIMVFRRK